jgi:acetyl esterase
MAGLLERIQRAARPPLHALTPQAARAAYGAGAEVLDLPRAPLARVESLHLPGGDGQPRPARLYAPVPRHEAPAHGLPAMLYLHGGGFVVGDLETHDALCRQLALRSGMAVVALAYRLAPEHPFPAALDDTMAALASLSREGSGLGLDSRRLAVGGDSAGGTLAATAAILARDAGLQLAFQLLITPGTAADAHTGSRHLFAQGFLIDAATIDWFFEHALAGASRADWRFSPLYAGDLEGVAPAGVILAECDPLVDEGLAYADRLRMAGVPVSLELARGVTHDFIKMGRYLPEAGQALDAAAEAMRQFCFKGDR